MSDSNNTTAASSGGIGLFGAMFLLFLGLKLGGVIDWSWWWVTAPLWGPLALTLVVVEIGLALWTFAHTAFGYSGDKGSREKALGGAIGCAIMYTITMAILNGALLGWSWWIALLLPIVIFGGLAVAAVFTMPEPARGGRYG